MSGRAFFLGAASLLTVAACANEPAPGGAAVGSQPTARTDVAEPRAVTPAAPTSASAALPKVRVHKSASCGCCSKWVDHMRQAGFEVEVHNTENLEPIKQRLGVPLGKGSCHTAEVGKWVVEGHVPAADIKRLLANGNGARGLVLPGMPAGSPGMEMPDGRVQRYTVEQINADGSTSPFATHGE